MINSTNHSSNIVEITTHNYFENIIYVSGWVFLIIGLPAIIVKWYVGIIILLLGIIITTTSFRVRIDLTKNQIEDFVFILGMKNNTTITYFRSLVYIIIKEGTYTQQLNLLSISSTVRGTVYSVYLVTDEKKYFLGESKSKKGAGKKALQIANQLNLTVREV